MVAPFLANVTEAAGTGAEITGLTGFAQYTGWIPVLPVVAFLLIIFVTRRLRMVSALVAIGCLAASCILSCLVLMERVQNPGMPAQVYNQAWIIAGGLQVNVGVLVDNLSAMMMFVVTLVGLLIQIYSTGYMSHEPDFGFGKFFAYLSLFTASMLGLVVSTNFVMIYMCWELVGLCSYLLIGFWYYKQSAADAAKKAFVVTRFGDIGFLAGIIAIFWIQVKFLPHVVPSLEFIGPGNALDAMAGLVAAHPYAVAVAAILVFCGAVGKSAQFPLHIWLPDAMEGPTPVSALIHAATMVAAGVYLVSRCFVMYQASPDAHMVVAWTGAITAIMAASMGIVQNDIKRVMAYSTVSQLGYMFMALGVGTELGYVAGNFHLFTHAFFKALLFLCCGSIIHAVNSNDMWKMGGLRRAMPITHLTMLAGCLALSGIPPFAGFWSKDGILVAAVQEHATRVPAILGYIAAFMTAFYVWRLYFVTFNGEYRGGDPTAAHDASPSGGHGHHGHDDVHHGGGAGEHAAPAHEVGPMGEQLPRENPPNMWIPLVVLALGAVGLGFLNAEALHLEAFTHYALKGHSMSHAEAGNPWPLLVLSFAIAAAGALLALAMYGREPKAGEARLKAILGPVYTLLEKKYYMDELWTWLAANTMFLGATVANWIDANIIDRGFVAGSGKGVFFFGQLLREEHSGKVQQYAMMMLVAVCVIIIGVGVAEPSFVLSPLKWWQQMHGGAPAPPTP